MEGHTYKDKSTGHTDRPQVRMKENRTRKDVTNMNETVLEYGRAKCTTGEYRTLNGSQERMVE